jgi:Protein of unknown function (DUF4238)
VTSLPAPVEKLRNRKDHWLPQGYLKGFIGPSRASQSKPLCCYYSRTQKWKHVSPKQIAFGEGFYDYANGTDYSAVTHPDSAFARMEREFPLRRKKMAADVFASWEQHKDFLLEFMQMVRARSPLAMQQREAEARNLRGATITAVDPVLQTLTVDSLELRPLPESYIRNFTISRMLEELKAGASWMTQLDWCLRYTDKENDPYCTTDQALFLIKTVKDSRITMELLQHPDTVIVFPLCWQACLFGNTRKFDRAYDRADPGQLQGLRSDQKRNANRFVVSPMTI